MTATESTSVSFFPREHGATAMLLSPFVCAIILARRSSLGACLFEATALVAIVCAFTVKDPLVAVLRQRLVWKQPHPETAAAWRWLAIQIAVLLACGVILLMQGPRGQYVALGLSEALFGALAVWMNLNNRQRSEWFQAISAIALTATSLVACLAALREVPLWGWELWVLCALQATAGIFVVHARLEARVATHRTDRSQPGIRRAAKIAIGVMVAAAAAATVLGFRWTIPAALLVTAYGYAYELGRHTNRATLKMPLTRVGLQMLTLSILYGALLIVGLW